MSGRCALEQTHTVTVEDAFRYPDIRPVELAEAVVEREPVDPTTTMLSPR